MNWQITIVGKEWLGYYEYSQFFPPWDDLGIPSWQYLRRQPKLWLLFWQNVSYTASIFQDQDTQVLKRRQNIVLVV